ncbi:MAG: hypothetical protein PHI41_07335 [Erysipelotrichaceae bacterium]|nr:hypothetical protein [Erysipelotrichaceae bacterium]
MALINIAAQGIKIQEFQFEKRRSGRGGHAQIENHIINLAAQGNLGYKKRMHFQRKSILPVAGQPDIHILISY